MTVYTFAQAAICDRLARQMYQDWAAFYGYTVPAFETLPSKTKKLWIDRALESIEVVGQLRSQKIIARITPAEPYGVDLNQAG